MPLHDTFDPLSLEGQNCHEACRCMVAVPMLTVIDTPLVGSNPHTRNGRSAGGVIARSVSQVSSVQTFLKSFQSSFLFF